MQPTVLVECARIWYNGRIAMKLLLNMGIVAAGGGAGAMARYALSLALQRASLTMPLGTLAANWSGCFIMGVLAAVIGRELPLSPSMRLLLATGFCGGLTTFSTFMYELHRLASAREMFYGVMYFLASFAGSAVAFLLGLLVLELMVQK